MLRWSKYIPRVVIIRDRHFGAFKDFKDYQYLEKSSLPTDCFQRSLPRLPIPKLEDTCQRYLDAQLPLLSPDEFISTSKYVREFKKDYGKPLQEHLKQYDSEHKDSSYIAQMWYDYYLYDRTPVAIDHNPMLVFERDKCRNQLVKATNFLISSLRFYNSLRTKQLSPDVYHINPKKSYTPLFHTICKYAPNRFAWHMAYLQKAFPLDMSQYVNLFNSTRIPNHPKDFVKQCPDSEHVIVIHNGNIYSINCFDDNGSLLQPTEYLGMLHAITNDTTQPHKCPVGALTTLDRDSWTKVRTYISNTVNRKNLEKIDSALFVISLEEEEVGNELINLANVFLHGDSRNRWFDKSFSLIISKDGDVGINFEHSWGDGIAVMRYVNEVRKDVKEKAAVSASDKPTLREDTRPYDRLEFSCDEHLNNEIQTAIKTFNVKRNSLGVEVYEGEGLDKVFCKAKGISPDAAMQLAFQDASYKLYGKLVATYESCSTAAFKHGRTETIRPCTLEVKNYCEAVNVNKESSNQSLQNLIKLCSTRHNQLTKEAAMGQGFDRHLFALKRFSDEKILPSIYEDPAYTKLNYNIISTSTLPSPVIWAGAFGPSVPTGFGVAYNINEVRHGVLITYYKDQADGVGFMQCLRQAFDEIYATFQ